MKSHLVTDARIALNTMSCLMATFNLTFVLMRRHEVDPILNDIDSTFSNATLEDVLEREAKC